MPKLLTITTLLLLGFGCTSSDDDDQMNDDPAPTPTPAAPELVAGTYDVFDASEVSDACDDRDLQDLSSARILFTELSDGSWTAVYGPFSWEAACTGTALELNCTLSHTTGSWSGSASGSGPGGSCSFWLDVSAELSVTGYGALSVFQTDTYTTECVGEASDIPYTQGSCDIQFTYEAALRTP